MHRLHSAHRLHLTFFALTSKLFSTASATKIFACSAKQLTSVVAAVAAVSKGRKARMRAKVRRIYDECMATDARLADCFLRDLSLAVRAPRQAAALKAAESLRGPDCPSHDLDVAGDNPRYGWSVG